jgi:hypothetical protein
MTKLRDIDLLSVGVGVVIGMLVLAMGIHIRHHRAIGRGAAPPPSGMQKQRRPEGPAPMMVGPRVADLVRLEKQRQGKTQEILDKVIGKGRSLVRVTVVDWDDRGDVIRLKRLSLALVVDQTKIVVDEEGGEVYSEPRSQEELAALTQLAVGAAGISRERGDRVVSDSRALTEARRFSSGRRQRRRGGRNSGKESRWWVPSSFWRFTCSGEVG